MAIENDSVVDGFFDFSALYERLAYEIPEGSSFAEIGVFRGASIIHFSKKIKELRKYVKIYAIDHWPKDHEYHSFFVNCIEAGVASMITPIRAPSGIAYRCFPANSLWAVYIDGDHRAESVQEDISHYLPLVQKYCAGHDVHLDSVKLSLSKTIGNNYEVIGKSWIYERSK